MTAPLFVDLATQAQLKCVGQEIVNWGGALPYRLHLFGHVPGFGMGSAERSAAQSQLHG